MLTFVARRLLLAVPVLLGVVFVVMLTVELIPGDAVALMLGVLLTDYGPSHLFFHDDPLKGMVVGATVVFYCVQVLLVAYLIWLRDLRKRQPGVSTSEADTSTAVLSSWCFASRPGTPRATCSRTNGRSTIPGFNMV